MSATGLEGAVDQYVPYTPFQEGYAFEPETSALGMPGTAGAEAARSPFVSEYGGELATTAEAHELGGLLFELYDTEFDDVLGEIAHEAWEAYAQRAEQFGEVEGSATAEEFLSEWSEPVRLQAEAMMDNIAEAIAETDLESVGEEELDAIFDRLTPEGTGLESYFEDFLGKLANKAKKLARKAASMAKSGLQILPGLRGLIGKLKALVKPLLDRVLRMALDKLPPALRPVARQLAQRILGATAKEAEDHAELEAPPAAADLSAVQQQFDMEAVQLLLASDETEQQLLVTHALQESARQEGAPVADLHEARARLVQDLEAGVNVQQALHQFIPAVMAVLPVARTAIKLIGRPRVVGFLARFLAAHLGGYVPKDAAAPLSRAIVDAGLRMLSLESSPEDDERLAAEAVVHTVEDAVSRLAELDEATADDPAALEVAVAEAFHAAAAENFPPDAIVPELHETPLRATWVALPRGARRKYYKKYTHVFDVEITPQIADAITTFGGTKLSAFLKDQLGVTAPKSARVHLYQAIHGTTLGRIARFERATPGLGSGGRAQLHPLTIEAAGTLLQQPRLGRTVGGGYRSGRGKLAVGQRFYYLEIPGARPVTAGAGGRARRSSEVNVSLDFPRDEFRVSLFLSEADAQEIAAQARRQQPAAVLLAARRVYQSGIATALGGDIQRHVKILAEAMPQEDFLGRRLTALPEQLRKQLTNIVVGWVGKGLAQYVGASASELVSATEDPADGITIIVKIGNPPGAPLVRRLLRGERLGLGSLAGLATAFSGQPRISVKTVPGFRFD